LPPALSKPAARISRPHEVLLIDAHLPPSLCRIFERAGHSAQSTARLPRGNNSTDEQIKVFCEPGEWVVVTKDKDFYYSHLLYKNPRKLLLVRCGNLKLREIIALFDRRMADIEAALLHSDLVELFSDNVGGAM
jgi:predicted nuclease of predicted toxin-antitoxin system